MHRIDGVLQHYAWGRRDAIAELRGVKPSGRPEAEYWLGAHPRGPALLLDNHPNNGVADVEGGVDAGPGARTLAAAIVADPDRWLGSIVRERFGELPFLLKLLAAEQPLSIQTHPDPAQAAEGFERENRAGIGVDDFKRNYRDANHKPELICAISRFEAKCGLRDLDDTRLLFAHLDAPELVALRDRLDVSGTPSSVLRTVISWLLELDHGDATALVSALVDRVGRLVGSPEAGPVMEFRPDLEWTLRINEVHPGDIGVAVALLMNHLTLEPGQALFLPSGVLHAYLSGLGVELMANSDNVLRCGLTAKHIDVDELLNVATFEPARPAVQRASGVVHRFESPSPEFSLCVIRPDVGDEVLACSVDGPEIVFVESGSAVMSAGDGQAGGPLRVAAGQAVAVPAVTGSYEMTVEAGGTVWRATVGRA